MKKIKSKKAIRVVAPRKSDDIIVNRKMLFSVRNELKSDIAATNHNMNVRFNQMDAKFSGLEARFNGLEARFDGLEARFDGLEARFDGLEAKFDSLDTKIDAKFERYEAKFDARLTAFEEKLLAAIHETHAKIHKIDLRCEDQERRNLYVLDGYTSLHDRIERLEKKDFDENL